MPIIIDSNQQAVSPEKRYKEIIFIHSITHMASTDPSSVAHMASTDPSSTDDAVSDVEMWTEKHRPKSLDGIISQPLATRALKNMLLSRRMQSVILYGGPGTGKTSSIHAVARELYRTVAIDGAQADLFYKKCVLEFNASDEVGIETIRSTLADFVKNQSVAASFIRGNKPSDSADGDKSDGFIPWKIVILDEADRMSKISQFALRRMIEMYAGTVMFCFIVNTVHKLIPAIQSRGLRLRYAPLNPTKVVAYLSRACTIEKLAITESALHDIVRLSQGDMRRALMVLQTLSSRFQYHQSIKRQFHNKTDSIGFTSSGVPPMVRLSSLPAPPSSLPAPPSSLIGGQLTPSPAVINISRKKAPDYAGDKCIESQDIFDNIGIPSFEDIVQVCDMLLMKNKITTDSVSHRTTTLTKLLNTKGWEIIDVIRGIHDYLITINILRQPILATIDVYSIFIELANIEKRMAMGGSQQLNIGALVSVMWIASS